MVKIDMEMPSGCFECPFEYNYHNIDYPDDPEWELMCFILSESLYDRKGKFKKGIKCPLINCDEPEGKAENGKVAEKA